MMHKGLDGGHGWHKREGLQSASSSTQNHHGFPISTEEVYSVVRPQIEVADTLDAAVVASPLLAGYRRQDASVCPPPSC
jgi:hypothetical protein